MVKTKKLNIIARTQLLQELRKEGWKGCLCDDCLLRLAEKILEYQERRLCGQ